MEHLIATAYLTQRLAGLGAPLASRVCDGIIPEAMPFPAIRLAELAAPDVRAGSQDAVIWTRVQMLVTLVDRQPSFVPMAATVAHLHALIRSVAPVVVTLNAVVLGQVLACTRVQPYTLIEHEAGSAVRHAGGIYDLLVQAL